MEAGNGWTHSTSASPETSFHKLSSTSTTHSRGSDAREHEEDDDIRKQEEFLQFDMTPPAHLVPGTAPPVPRSSSSIGDFASNSAAVNATNAAANLAASSAHSANPGSNGSISVNSSLNSSTNSNQLNQSNQSNQMGQSNQMNGSQSTHKGHTKRYSFHASTLPLELRNEETSADLSILNGNNVTFEDQPAITPANSSRRQLSASEENSRILSSRMDGLNINNRSFSTTENERVNSIPRSDTMPANLSQQRAVSPDLNAARKQRRYEGYGKRADRPQRPLSQIILSEAENTEEGLEGRDSLSFHSEQYKLTPISPIVPSAASFGPDSAFASRVETSERMDGVRYRESLIRALKDENLELKLKIQQMKEIGALPDKSRSISQLSRAERRVTELELALSAKNRTIAQLIAENEQNMNSRNNNNDDNDEKEILMDALQKLQQAITELEAQAEEEQRIKREVVAKAHSEMPDFVPEKADTKELVSVIQELVNEGAELTREVETMRLNTQALKQAAIENSEAARLLEQALQSARKSRDEDVDELRSQLREVSKQHESAARNADEARENAYKIIRSFFRTIIENCDEMRNNEINGRLQDIVAKCQRKRVSKTPYLIKFMIECTNNIASTSLFLNERHAAHDLVKDKECEVRSLEAILAQRFDKVGGDAFLRSQVSELKEALKREQERRHAEREDFVRTIAALQKR